MSDSDSSPTRQDGLGDRVEGVGAKAEWPEIVRRIRARTPARVFAGRAGAAYTTSTQLDLRAAHAAARDAVRTELDLPGQLGDDFLKCWNLMEVSTEARSKDEYLLQPQRGREFSENSRRQILQRCVREPDLEIVIGDGLSVSAVLAQVPRLLPILVDGAKARGWSLGSIFVIRYCRVGIINQIGDLLAPTVVVLLIGERPGLATANSLSAYMAYRPQPMHSDAERNLISNIHERGVSHQDAAAAILDLAGQMMKAQLSGTALHERIARLTENSDTR
jgi:ethanolamine ammonia-lyase small subunit